MAIRPLPYFAALAISSLTMNPSGMAIATGRLISMASTTTCSGRSSDASIAEKSRPKSSRNSLKSMACTPSKE
jgi:hypothetical protein